MTTKAIYIVSPECLLREAIAQLIQAPGFAVVNRDASLADLLQEVSGGPPPDLVMSILHMYQSATAELENLKDLHDKVGSIKTMLLMPPEQQVALYTAEQSGVDAILTTKVTGAALRHFMDLVFLGERILMPDVLSLPDDGPAPKRDPLPEWAAPPASPPSRNPRPILSMREQEILRGLVDGHPNKVIARELAITEATVKVHMKALLRKIQTTNRTQTAIWAVNNGFATQDHRQGNDDAALSGTPIVSSTRQLVHASGVAT